MSQETLKTQECVCNDTISLILRVERSQPITQTVHKSPTKLSMPRVLLKSLDMISILCIFSRSKLQTKPEARVLS